MIDGRRAMEIMGMKGKPARNRSDIDKQGYLSNWNPIDADWKKRINQFWWGTGYCGTIAEDVLPMLKLRDRLLAIDGEEVCLPDKEEDLEDLLTYGQIWIGRRKVIMQKGRPNQCHENACLFWKEYREQHPVGNFGIVTGYALSDDGMWRQHSWCIWKMARTYRIIETTEHRELYYGFCMLDQDAENFCDRILHDS